MRVSTFTNSKAYLPTTSKDYLHTAKQWFFKTPERSLNQAYNAILTIKAIEDEYFQGNKISAEATNYSNNIMSCFQADLEKNLSIAKLKLAEFKASRAVLGLSNSSLLEKLRFIDEVLDNYMAKPQAASNSLVPVSTSRQTTAKQTQRQLHLSNVEVSTRPTGSEQANFLPKSIGKTINRVTRELDPEGEAKVVNKFRSSRTKTTTAVRFILVLILVPLLTQHVSKQFLIAPIVDHMRSGNEAPIFLKSEMKEEALHELQSFEEELKLESLIYNTPSLTPEAIEERVKHKAEKIASESHSKGNSAISNVFADLLALVAFSLVIFTSKRQIVVLKSFIDDIVHGLSDGAKAFIIILFTDIFVGFHSPHGWEVILEGLASHLGLPANRNLIFLFIATFPVILDAIFKFWIFQYMSRLSASAVATYRNMNE